jgi:hypothetical protein
VAKKKPILRAEQWSGEARHFFEAVNKEGDLPLVLMGASALEGALGTLLSHYLLEGRTTKNLFESVNGALSTFASRIQFAYCLGLIPKGMRHNLDRIRDV